MIEEFVDDDMGYVEWLRSHPSGFVINCDRRPTQYYLALHRVRCARRSPPRTADFRRVCSASADELCEWVLAATGVEPTRCDSCHP